jgi:hypothetical protein
MQTSEFGKSKGLWKSLSEGTWRDAFDGLGISLLLTSNPSIQVLELAIQYIGCMYGSHVEV